MLSLQVVLNAAYMLCLLQPFLLDISLDLLLSHIFPSLCILLFLFFLSTFFPFVCSHSLGTSTHQCTLFEAHDRSERCTYFYSQNPPLTGLVRLYILRYSFTFAESSLIRIVSHCSLGSLVIPLMTIHPQLGSWWQVMMLLNPSLEFEGSCGIL